MTEMWERPDCGHTFRWRNQWHSCTNYTVDDHLVRNPQDVVALYRHFESVVLDLGDDVVVEPAKTYISFRGIRRSAGCIVQEKGLNCGVILPSEHTHSRFTRVWAPIPTQWEHRFRIDTSADLDDNARGWLASAYQMQGTE